MKEGIRIILYATICFNLHSSSCKGQLIHCSKGSLSFSTKDNPGFININCDAFPIAATFPVKNPDKCFNSGGETLNIVSRAGWNAAENSTKPIVHTKPRECILVDGQLATITGNNYVKRLQDIQKLQNSDFGSMLDNFYIGNNRRIYEALGWDSINNIGGGGLKCLSISFLKASSDDPPSPEAIEAFKKLVKAAICLGKLTAEYKLIPSYLIDDRHALEETSFERNQMKKWKSYHANPNLVEPPIFWKHGVVFREEWSMQKRLGEWYNFSGPIMYVVIGNFYRRCFQNCIDEVRNREIFDGKSGSDMKVNFYIGDDGLAYEVFGWDHSFSDGWSKDNAVSIDFLGKFNSYSPSDSAINALKHLLRLGVNWGKLSSEYKILLLHKYTNTNVKVGNSLQEIIMKMPHYPEKKT